MLKSENPFVLQWSRLFYMYGEGQSSNSLLAQLDASIDRGDTEFNMSGGEQLRDYLPVEKVALRLCDIHLERADGIFNVCSGVPISVRNLVERRVKERKAYIKLNIGQLNYPVHESMAFWGENSEGTI